MYGKVTLPPAFILNLPALSDLPGRKDLFQFTKLPAFHETDFILFLTGGDTDTEKGGVGDNHIMDTHTPLKDAHLMGRQTSIDGKVGIHIGVMAGETMVLLQQIKDCFFHWNRVFTSKQGQRLMRSYDCKRL